jgi:hypothetical protein
MNTYLIPKARNLVTKQVVLEQDLSGARYNQRQQSQCQLVADRLAAKMSQTTRQPWIGFVDSVKVARST